MPLPEDLNTPCLLLDPEKMHANMHAMSQRIAAHGVTLRPHFKTAKSTELFKMHYGSVWPNVPLTVSTVAEAEHVVAAGVRDVIYAVGIVPAKLKRLWRMLETGADVKVILDAPEHVTLIEQAARDAEATARIRCLIELDCDGHRSGIDAQSAKLLEIATSIHSSPACELAGVLTHAGESYVCPSVEQIAELAERERQAAIDAADRLKDAGLPCPIISVGSTPTARFGECFDGVTEVRAGVYMFFDLFMAGLGVCRLEDIALSVAATVIGHQPDKGWVITDAGWMALSRDRGTQNQAIDRGYGLVCDEDGQLLDGLQVIGTHQEHGIIASTTGQTLTPDSFPVGTRLSILPNHACATAAMHQTLKLIPGQKIGSNAPRVTGW